MQEKYAVSYYIVENDKVNLNAYCLNEREQATKAFDAIQKQAA